MKHLRNSNGNTEQESVLANKDSCKEFEAEFRVLEARLNLLKGFSELSEQLGINVIGIVPFFKTEALHN